VIVRELASGRQWQLQVAQAAISSVSWDSRGRIAIVAFLSVLQTGQPAAGFLITPSELNQTFDKSDLRQVSGGCNVQSATFDTAGLLVLQGCPTITDTARLTQLDASLHPLWSATPVATPNGAHLSVAADGRSILVSTWSTTATTDFVSIYSGPKLVTRYQYVNPTNSVTNAVW